MSKRPNWYHDRRAVLTEAQATDVIRNCLEPSDDAICAARYGVTRQCISDVRRGRTWAWLRSELSCVTSVAKSP